MSHDDHHPAGRIERVNGSVVWVRGLDRAHLSDVVRVGPHGLVGEVIRIEGALTVVEVYEETSGLRAGEPVACTGAPLQVELGPGLVGRVVDGIGRPLEALTCGPEGPLARPFLCRGAATGTLDRTRRWEFEPSVRPGDRVAPGDIVGTVRETRAFVHRVLVPPGFGGGTVTEVRAGPHRVEEPVLRVDGRPLPMLSRWPVRTRRPALRRLEPDAPLITGQRVIDALFPLARGGTATIPGGFGTGKTVAEQALARWAEVDLVIYVGCGERGNELTEILEGFPRIVDPRTGASLIERTVVIANTSNMPVAAREASIYAGITMAEYFRDQGRDVALLADSTSRWAEALREISGRLEEMPGEEGYPAYLAARLAEFYERAGSFEVMGAPSRAGASSRPGAPSPRGSVSIVAAVSPPGADFSEPVTQASLRLAGTFWALDTDLARRRHFPAIHWGRSYALADLAPWFRREVGPDWEEKRRWALALLQEEATLQEIVSLLGMEALAPAQRAVLATGRLLREHFLQQSAFDDVDAFTPPRKQLAMLRVLHDAHRAAAAAVARGVSPERVVAEPAFGEIARMRWWPPEEASARAEELSNRLEAAAAGLLPAADAAGS